MLNDEEKQSSQHQMELHNADQLDAILDRIRQIEAHEDSLIQQGLVLGYSVSTQLDFAHLGHVKQREAPQSELTAEPVGSQAHDSADPLVLPLGVVMNLEISVDPVQHLSAFADASDFDDEAVPADEIRSFPQHSSLTKRGPRKVSALILSGRRYLSIEKRRQQFQRHRRLVEASLAGTGMDQCAVIEM